MTNREVEDESCRTEIEQLAPAKRNIRILCNPSDWSLYEVLSATSASIIDHIGESCIVSDSLFCNSSIANRYEGVTLW